MLNLISVDLHWANDTQGQTLLTPPCGWDIQASCQNSDSNKSIYSDLLCYDLQKHALRNWNVIYMKK